MKGFFSALLNGLTVCFYLTICFFVFINYHQNRLAAIDLDKNSTNLCNNFIHTVNMLGENTLTPPNKHQESIDSSLYSCTSTAATTPSQDNNMMTCNGSCDQIYSQHMQSNMDMVTGEWFNFFGYYRFFIIFK
jgi:hypothetical protein